MSNKDLNIIRQFDSADLEEFKRPDHDDFKTSAELRAGQFSGLRENSLTQELELWIRGDLKLAMATETVRNDPKAWERRYAEVMGFKGEVIMSPPATN